MTDSEILDRLRKYDLEELRGILYGMRFSNIIAPANMLYEVSDILLDCIWEPLIQEQSVPEKKKAPETPVAEKAKDTREDEFKPMQPLRKRRGRPRKNRPLDSLTETPETIIVKQGQEHALNPFGI